jgi:hypothetical protein
MRRSAGQAYALLVRELLPHWRVKSILFRIPGQLSIVFTSIDPPTPCLLAYLVFQRVIIDLIHEPIRPVIIIKKTI